jgi:N4-gp56 family major capsid protein
MQSTTTLSANLWLYYVKKLLSTLEPRLATYQLGERTSLPKGMGTQVKWLRYARLAGNTSPLTEGVVPSDVSLATVNITANISQYGEFVKITDLISDTAIDPVMESHSERLGAAAAATVEQLNIAELDANSGIMYVNKRANDNAVLASDVPTLREFFRVSKTLAAAYVPKHRKFGAYMAVLHPNTEYDLLAETNLGSIQDLSKYSVLEQKQVAVGEIGRALGIRFVVSDLMNSAANTSSVQVYRNYVAGDECFGVVELGGKNMELIIKDRKSGGTSNPLEQFGTVGYKLPGYVCKYFGTIPGGTLHRLYQLRGASNM